jgi:hypothetical protein
MAFGLVVFGILEHLLWPVRASDRQQQRFPLLLLQRKTRASATQLGVAAPPMQRAASQ